MKKICKSITLVLVAVCLGLSLWAVSPAISGDTQTAYAQVITVGDSGNTVKTIQQKLKNWGYYKGAVDGIFGSQTKQAVRYFQQKNGLKVDGIVGNQT